MEDTTRYAAAASVNLGTRRRFMRNTSFSLFQQIVNIGIGIMLVPFLLWQLGTQGYGLWLTLQLFNIFGLMALADLGFQGALIRHLVKYRSSGDVAAFRRLLSTALALFTLIGLLGAGGIIIFAQTIFTSMFEVPGSQQSVMRLALTVYAVHLAISFPLLVFKAVFSGTQDVATLKLCEAIERVVFAALVVGVLLIEKSLLALVICDLAALAITAVIIVISAKRRHPQWCSAHVSLVTFRGLDEVASMSGLVFVYNAANQLFVKGPDVLVGIILGPSALAYVTIATRIPRVLKTLQSAVNAAVLPHASLLDTQTGDLDAKGRFTLAGLRASYLVMVPASLFLIVFAQEVLAFWVGDSYAWLGPFMVAAFIWQLLGTVSTFGGATLTSNAQIKKPAWALLVVNAGLLGLLASSLDRLGLPGLFVALLVASAVGSAIMLSAVAYANGFGYRTFARSVIYGPVMVSGLTGLALFSTAHRLASPYGDVALLLAAGGAGCLYLAMLYTVVLLPSEKHGIKRLFAKLWNRS